MDKSGANAFVFAKANGILGKSFTNNHARQLFGAKSLAELWTLLFKTQPPLVPEVLLSQQIEEKAFSDFISSYIKFIDAASSRATAARRPRRSSRAPSARSRSSRTRASPTSRSP